MTSEQRPVEDEWVLRVDTECLVPDARALIAEAQYQSYAYNRCRSPLRAPERWAGIWENWEALEARYQKEVRP